MPQSKNISAQQLLMIALEHFKIRDYVIAIRCLNSVITLDTQPQSAYYWRARAYFELVQLEEAKKDLDILMDDKFYNQEQYLEDSANTIHYLHVKYYYALCLGKLTKGKLTIDKSDLLFDNFLKDMQFYEQLHGKQKLFSKEELATLYYKLGITNHLKNPGRALQYLDMAISYQPKLAKAYTAKARRLTSAELTVIGSCEEHSLPYPRSLIIKNIKKIIAIHQKAINLEPTDARHYHEYAQTIYYLGGWLKPVSKFHKNKKYYLPQHDWEGAYTLLLQGLKINPLHRKSLVLLKQIAETTKNDTLLIHVCKTLVQMEGSFSNHQALIRALIKRGELTNAIYEIHEAQKKWPDSQYDDEYTQIHFKKVLGEGIDAAIEDIDERKKQIIQLRQKAYSHTDNFNSGNQNIFTDDLSIKYEEIQWEKIDHEKVKLGSGAFSVVYAATWNNWQIAVKEFNQAKQNPVEEVKNLIRLKHKHIIRLLGVTQKDQQFFMIMPRMEKSLSDYIYNNPDYKVDITIIVQQTLEIALGLEFLHKSKIGHYDIKSKNILLDKQGTLMIADFGLAKVSYVENTCTTLIQGTPNWMAPEQFYGRPVPASDIYSLALVASELCNTAVPSANMLYPEIIFSRTKTDEPPVQLNPIIEKTSSYALLLNRMWMRIPENRPSSSEVVQQLQDIDSSIRKAKPEISNNNSRELNMRSVIPTMTRSGLISQIPSISTANMSSNTNQNRKSN